MDKRSTILALRRVFRGDRFTANGVDITLPPSTNTELRYILARGRPYEAEEARFVRQAISKGTQVIELGGSLGVVSAVIRDAIGKGAKHIVVEANADLAPICLANGSHGADPGACELVTGAVAYTEADTVGFSFGHNPHVGSIDPTGGAVQVPAVTLTELASRLEGDFALVADIEGAEWDMIFEEEEVFDRISSIILEVHPEVFKAAGHSEDALMARLDALGFTLQERDADVLLLGRSGP